MDDRTHAERPTTSSHAALSGDDRLAGSGTRPLSKSRYDGINYYIGARADTATFNDMPIAMDQEHFERLVHAEFIACLRAMLLICSPVIHLLYVQTASRLMMVMMSIAGKTCKLRIELDCRPGAIAQPLALRKPKCQKTAESRYFGRQPEIRNNIKTLQVEGQRSQKYSSMNTNQVSAALLRQLYR